ncbi:ATP-binding protein [Allofranklinella schreckenbergeri]|uniref:ATP-binding protein n=1 Tax=Allofranklinella schreckenbergeri TaxID=1076744 RepID=A0A3M6R296_9BURK|nr:ATP-binding protein [Allofranklinella schreckenbergeri]RMX09404.1 ATP-binding protein [Allofranklinella schreckenbergeri]
MLEKARFQNFTCIPNETWAFASGVNVIVGENGLGKSHVLKALYALLKVQADSKDLSKSTLEKAYADKLMAVLRPESLGRLTKRKQGRERCELVLTLAQAEHNCAIGFATNAKSQVNVDQAPSASLPLSPVYLPTRELVTLCPWFLPLYDNYRLEFEETWRDTVSLLGNPSVKGAREKQVAKLLKPLEAAMGGRVVVDTQSGRFYLKSGEGQMEMPLVAEGLRKMAMLARLISTGTLLQQGYLFWDEPETNLNPKLIKTLAASIVAVAQSGVQVFIATHSLFLLRELEMLLADKPYAALPRRWFALAAHGDEVTLEQSEHIEDIQTLVMLDEELAQSDRFMQSEVGQ